MKNNEKELQNQFLGTGFFIGALVLCASPIAILKNTGIAFPIITSGTVILLAAIVTIWTYFYRTKAIAYLIGTSMRLFMLITLFSFTTDWSEQSYIWSIFILLVLSIQVTLIIFIELKSWPTKLEAWKKIKKIDLKKGFYNITVTRSYDQDESKKIILAMIFAPGVGVLIARWLPNFNVLLDNVLYKLISLGLILIFGYLLGQILFITGKLFQLEKNHNITFTTEYRKYVKK